MGIEVEVGVWGGGGGGVGVGFRVGIDLELGFGWGRYGRFGYQSWVLKPKAFIAGRCYSRVMVASDSLATMTLE